MRSSPLLENRCGVVRSPLVLPCASGAVDGHDLSALKPQIGAQCRPQKANAAQDQAVVAQQVDATARRQVRPVRDLIAARVAVVAPIPPEIVVAGNVDDRRAGKAVAPLFDGFG
jgi:hypothetical protein